MRALTDAGSDVTPQLVAADDGVLVMADLGDHRNVASYLLGSDPLAAHKATLAWAAALGNFHRFGRRARAAFGEIAAEPGDYMPGLLDEAAADLVTLAADLGVVVRHGFDPLRHVRFCTPLEVLSAGDMGPDNNLVDGTRVKFIDLEFATIRHLAWDVAYLFVPWPSCWCAWRLPNGLPEAALREWRRTFAPADWSSVLADVGLAADAWRWMSVSWLLPSLATGWPVRADRPAPPVADRIVASLDALTTSDWFAELRDTAGDLGTAIRRRFAVAPLAASSAWR